MSHAAKISFSLLAYVRCEEDVAGRRDLGVCQSGGNSEECSDPGCVVAGAGGAKDVAIDLGLKVGLCREDGIDVRRQENEQLPLRGLSQKAECVALGVDVYVVQAKITKAVAHPFGPGSLPERRRRDANEIDLPVAQALLLQMKPAKGTVD